MCKCCNFQKNGTCRIFQDNNCVTCKDEIQQYAKIYELNLSTEDECPYHVQNECIYYALQDITKKKPTAKYRLKQDADRELINKYFLSDVLLWHGCYNKSYRGDDNCEITKLYDVISYNCRYSNRLCFRSILHDDLIEYYDRE